MLSLVFSCGTLAQGEHAELSLCDTWAGSLSSPMSPLRPSPTFVHTSTHFRVNYTLHGSDATTHDYAVEIAALAESSYTVQCLAMGFAPPPVADTLGGNQRWDIFIREMSANGRTVRRDSLAGANGWTSHIEIRRGITNANALREVVAHEFHHMIQFGYSRNAFLGSGAWFSENNAQWVVPFVFPSAMQRVITGSINSGPGPLRTPWWSITANNTGDFVNYAYGGALWPTFLVEWVGDSSIVRRIYERFRNSSTRQTFADIAHVLELDYARSLASAFKDYAVWRNFTGACRDSTTSFCVGNRNDGFHFSEAARYGFLNARSTTTLPFQHDSVVLGPGSCAYISVVERSGPLNICFSGRPGGSWALLVLGIRTPLPSVVHEMSLNPEWEGCLSVQWSEADSFVVVPVRTDTLPTPLRYRLRFSIGGHPGDGCPHSGVLEKVGVDAILSGRPHSFPNPFNPNTNIQYSLLAEAHVRLTLWDILGRELTTLVDGVQPAGKHIVRLDGTSMASGVYFYILEVTGDAGQTSIHTNRVILAR